MRFGDEETRCCEESQRPRGRLMGGIDCVGRQPGQIDGVTQ